jgi:hypothetical protein
MSADARPLTALEKKWQEEEANKAPSLEDAYTVEGLKPQNLDQAVVDRWRIAILPYRGAEKTKGGIVWPRKRSARPSSAPRAATC